MKAASINDIKKELANHEYKRSSGILPAAGKI